MPVTRSATNIMWPPLPFRCFDGTKASSQVADDIAKGLKLSREEAGDLLGSGGKRIKKLLPKPDDLVHATFAAVPQENHLGVEFATQSHRTLLQGDGLLDPWSELTCAAPCRGSTVLQGLVIDDFFALSQCFLKGKTSWFVGPFPRTRETMRWISGDRSSSMSLLLLTPGLVCWGHLKRTS